MGLKVTTSTATSEGMTTKLYLHIIQLYQTKTGSVQAGVKYFVEKGGATCLTFQPFKTRFDFQLEGQELIDGITKTEAYGKIKAELQAAGKTVVDLV